MSFLLSLVTPRGIYKEEEIESLTIKLISGYRTILSGHAPLIGALDVAPMHYIKNGIVFEFALHGGALNVKEDKVVVITNAVEEKDDIDINRAQEAKKRAEERLSSNDPNIDVKRAELALKRALVRIEIAKK